LIRRVVADLNARMMVGIDPGTGRPNCSNVVPDVVVGARRRRAPTLGTTLEQFGRPVPGSIPTIIRAFKSATTRRINEWRGTPGARVWQRNYWEHIVRNEKALERIRRYILTNPARWQMDRENPYR
jgi:hypothetical protein